MLRLCGILACEDDLLYHYSAEVLDRVSAINRSSMDDLRFQLHEEHITTLAVRFRHAMDAYTHHF